jgi:hypothetical protein
MQINHVSERNFDFASPLPARNRIEADCRCFCFSSNTSNPTTRNLIADGQSRVASENSKLVEQGAINLDAGAKINTGTQLRTLRGDIVVTQTGISSQDVANIIGQYAAKSATAPATTDTATDATGTKAPLVDRLLEAIGVKPPKDTTAEERTTLKKEIALVIAIGVGGVLVIRYLFRR